MARAVWSGAVTFGLVNIPAKVYMAASGRDIRFATIHAKCNTRLKRPYMCPSCNEPVKSDEMVKGYEYGKDNFVLLTEEEMDSVSSPTDKAINVIGFVDADDIAPLLYEKSYYIGPQEAAVKPWELLRQALLRTNKVAIARATMWRKQQLLAIRPLEGTLVLTLLYYADEVKGTPEMPVTQPLEIADAEIDLATKLIGELTMEFDPGEYKDAYRESLLQLIEAKVEGKEIEVVPQTEAAPTQDLMAALKASLEAAKKA